MNLAPCVVIRMARHWGLPVSDSIPENATFTLSMAFSATYLAVKPIPQKTFVLRHHFVQAAHYGPVILRHGRKWLLRVAVTTNPTANPDPKINQAARWLATR